MIKLKSISLVLAVLALMLSFSACETEVDLFTDPEDVAVVYALLDQGESVQYFRINPTFIGDGDARILAGDTSLTNYNPKDLDVRLYDLELGEDFFYQAEETMEKLDPNGLFDENIRMFKINTPVYDSSNGFIVNTVIKPDHTYRLWIHNSVSKKTYTSEIQVGDINKLVMSSPSIGRPRLPSNWLKFHSSTEYIPFKFKFKTIDGADRYRLSLIYYHYVGLPIYDVDSNILNLDSSILSIGEEIIEPGASSVTFDFEGEDFYSILNSKLDPATNRTGEYFDIVISAIGTDLNNYIEVANVSSTGLSQERPEYSNIDNGLGIFSFQSTKIFHRVYLNNFSQQELIDGPYTNDRFTCARYGNQSDSKGVVSCP